MNSVRSIMLKKMVGENEELSMRSKVDLSRLPPCRDNLVPHIDRVNQAIFWRPNPYESRQSWEKTEEGVLEPVWSCGPILPPSLVDLLEKTAEEMEDVADEEGQEIEYEELLSDDE